MVQARGSCGGMITQPSVFPVSADVVLQLFNKINAVIVRKYLYKEPAPNHAQPDNSDQNQTEHDRCGTHILGPAG